jgi:hypothetical protein
MLLSPSVVAIKSEQPSEQNESAKINEPKLVLAEEEKKEVAEIEKIEEKPI